MQETAENSEVEVVDSTRPFTLRCQQRGPVSQALRNSEAFTPGGNLGRKQAGAPEQVSIYQASTTPCKGHWNQTVASCLKQFFFTSFYWLKKSSGKKTSSLVSSSVLLSLLLSLLVPRGHYLGILSWTDSSCVLP